MVLFCGNQEPTLEELLVDPIMHLLLARNGLTAEDMRALVDALRQKLRARSGGPERRARCG
jgi:hypothetical protein